MRYIFLTSWATIPYSTGLVCCDNTTFRLWSLTLGEQQDVRTVPLLTCTWKCWLCKLIHQIYKHRPGCQALLWSSIAQRQQCGNGLLSATDQLLTWHNSIASVTWDTRHSLHEATVWHNVTRAARKARYMEHGLLISQHDTTRQTRCKAVWMLNYTVCH